jgi:hypothetical protein
MLLLGLLLLLLLMESRESKNQAPSIYLIHKPPLESLELPLWGMSCRKQVKEYVNSEDRTASRQAFCWNPHKPPMKRKHNKFFPKPPKQFESMAETNPSLAIELDMENNDRFITPWSVVAGTGYYLSWRCLTCKHKPAV